MVWLAWPAPSLVGCQALSYAETAGHWWAGPGYEAAGCGALGGPRASADLLGQSWVMKWVVVDLVV